MNLFAIAFFFQTLRITIPYLLPSIGAVYSEKGGVVNIALEGIMLMRCILHALWVHIYTGNVCIGIIFGMLAGILTVAHPFICYNHVKANQIVSGIALNILAFGVTKFLLQDNFQQLKQFRPDTGT